jgi:hypothetical protein
LIFYADPPVSTIRGFSFETANPAEFLSFRDAPG